MLLGISEEIIARQPPEAQAIIRLLLAEIAKLEARIKELEGGRKTPQNSSLPPSSVHPHAKPALPKRKSKKKRGGQPGHKKHERSLIPTEDCDDVKPLKPTECRRCGEKLSGNDPEPLRHPMRSRRYARHVPGTVRTPSLAVDLPASRRNRSDEQCGRAVVASCGDLAQAFLRDAKRQRQPLRRDPVDGSSIAGRAEERLTVRNIAQVRALGKTCLLSTARKCHAERR